MFRQGNQVNGFIAFVHLDHATEDFAVRLPIEIVRREDLDRFAQGLVVKKNGSENRPARPRGFAEEVL